MQWLNAKGAWLGPWLLLTLAIVACGDDIDIDRGEQASTAGDGDAGDGVAGDGDAGDGDAGDGDGGVGDGDAGDGDAGDGDAGVGDGEVGDGDTSAAEYPTLQPVLSLSGCEAIGLGPLCSVEQRGALFEARCGALRVTGEVDEERRIGFELAPFDNGDGARVSVSCAGKLPLNGGLLAACTAEVAATDAQPASEATCDLKGDALILPELGCMELPSELELSLCTDGTRVDTGACRVVQDGCLFQAECADDLVLTGSVAGDGLRFSHPLTALADAEVQAEGDVRAFLAGELVQHDCTAVLDGTSVTGSCSAGRASRRGTDTSVCALAGSAGEVPACELLSPDAAQLFALESCAELKSEIGEPVCAYRQNNCVWELQCGNGPGMRFAGRLTPGADRVEFRLATGTPCELSFDAEGNMTGKCAVPGETACQVASKPAVPGGDECVALPTGTSFTNRGCGHEGLLACQDFLQHGCRFMAACAFGRYPAIAIAGEASVQDGRNHLEFNGAGDYRECYVDEASEAEIGSGDRIADEWYGQCTNATTGGQCRDNYDPETGEGYRGLQVFFNYTPPVTEP